MEKENCTCGCNDEHNHVLTEGTVTLTLDDEEEVDCAIIRTYEAGGKEYIALLPLDEEGDNEDGAPWIYRFIRDTTGDDEHELQAIEDDEEFEIAADAFDEWLDELEFEEMASEDE